MYGLIVASLLFFNSAFAKDTIALTLRGKKVILHADGKWEYNSDAKKNPDTPEEGFGEIVATVNGIPVGSISFAHDANRTSPKDGNQLTLEERKEVLDELIIEELLYQKALENGYSLDPKVKKVMVNALIRDEVYAGISNSDFSDAELEAYFNAHKEDFTIPEKVQIYSILIKVTDDRTDADAKSKADRIYTELTIAPSTFRDVASNESENPYSRRGGDMGFVTREGKPGLDSTFVEKAFSMEVKTLSQPFKTPDGWNIIYIPSKKEGYLRSFAQMKGSVLRKVKNKKLKQEYDAFTEDLKNSAQITIDEAALNRVELNNTNEPSPPPPQHKEH
jgi:peptidyl-prolyl cis-trans isomerase C